MKRFLFGFLAVLFLILNTIPYLHIMADQSMTDAQIKQVGAFALSSLITSGEATELDFSDYTDSDTDFLLGIGELIMTGDPSGLIDCGLDWLGGEIDDAYDSAIQSIREWEYNMSPTLYYWFVDTQPPYDLSPTYNNIRDLAQPLRRLLTPPDDNSSPIPQPDPNYQTLIDYMNKKDSSVYNSFWFYNFNQVYYYNASVNFTFDTYPLYNYSWVSFGSSNGQGAGFINANTGLCCATDILDIQITSNNGSYNLDKYIYGLPNIIHRQDNTQFNSVVIGVNGYNTFIPNNTSGSFHLTSSGSLNVILNYLKTYVKNVNIYVDGVCWAYVGGSPEYPIVIPDQLTIWNDQPLQYEFPSDTYLKLPDLTNIITNAINNSGVVMWSDIADCFVDVNGQTAVAVTKIVRNDYDNLYMEQYPYPAMLPGMTEQTKFNEHLLDDSHAYLSPIGTVVQETVYVLPPELVGVLAIGAILTIFAVIINRLLE